MSDKTDDATWLDHVVRLATANVADGGGPFGAVIVRDGSAVAEGSNRVTVDVDPTAHAEITAIRAASKRLGVFDLSGCTLYTSCEPCPMCLAAALWSRLDRVVHAADRDDAARGGFDDRAFYELFARPRSEWSMAVEIRRIDGAVAPFDAWLAKPDRTRY